MLRGIWGKKIGMTQAFAQNNVVPATVIDIGHWFITNIKTVGRDGYAAIQVGLLRKKYYGKEFDNEWLKNNKRYFAAVKEIKASEQDLVDVHVGKPFDMGALLEAGSVVHVFGITKGKGFQGVVKRHGFSGGRASHGPRFGRWPGSLSFMRSQGRVIKGKKMPGHDGVVRRVVRNLEVLFVKEDACIAVVKGSVPGNAGSLVFMEKA